MRKPRGAAATADSTMSGRHIRIWGALTGSDLVRTVPMSTAPWMMTDIVMVDIVLPIAHTREP
jgi:hypothetical protein